METAMNRMMTEITCPHCGQEKTQGYIYCNYDCYTETKIKGTIINRMEVENHPYYYPVLFNRQFKHIPPRQKNLYKWNEETKRWTPKDGTKNKEEYQCPETEETGVTTDYCEGFCFGQGCRHLKTCKNYQDVKKPLITKEDESP